MYLKPNFFLNEYKNLRALEGHVTCSKAETRGLLAEYHSTEGI